MIEKAMLVAIMAVALLKSAQPLGNHMRHTFCGVAASLSPTSTVLLCVDKVPYATQTESFDLSARPGYPQQHAQVRTQP